VGKKLHLGDLSDDTTDSDLGNLFQPHGTAPSAQVIKDRDAGRSKGFGFVEMDGGGQAQAAIDALNGQEVNGRALTVNEARPRAEQGESNRGLTGSSVRGDCGGGRRYSATPTTPAPFPPRVGGRGVFDLEGIVADRQEVQEKRQNCLSQGASRDGPK
jgi:cold-inducible RNA-binding protein